MGHTTITQPESKIMQTATNMPGKPTVSHDPLGGKVGIPAAAEQEIIIANDDSIVNTHVSEAINVSYGQPGTDGKLLNHLRRRNLGY